jgi:hypothetical protein
VKQNKCIHHDMKNEKCQKTGVAECSARKDSPVRNRSHCLGLLRPGLDLDWLLQLDLLLGQLLGLGRLAEEGLAPGVGPAAEVGLPAAEVGLPREAGPLAESPSS